MTLAVTIPGADGVRAYIRTLRIAHGYSQPEFAKRVGLSARGYIDYELGDTQELKQSTLVRAIEALSAPFEDIRDLILCDADADAGRAKALKRYAPDIQAQIRELEETEEGQLALIGAARRYQRRKKRADKPEHPE